MHPFLVLAEVCLLNLLLTFALKKASNHRPKKVQPFANEFCCSFIIVVNIYQNGYILTDYGIPAFILMFSFILWTNMYMFNACLNPINVFDQVLKSERTLWNGTVTIACQVAGGCLGSMTVLLLWLLPELAGVPVSRAEFLTQTCLVTWQEEKLGMIVEIAVTTMTKIAARKTVISGKWEQPVHTLTNVMVLAIGMKWTGSMMNPALASALTNVCPNRITSNHLVVYWLAPFIGISLSYIINHFWHGKKRQAEEESEVEEEESRTPERPREDIANREDLPELAYQYRLYSANVFHDNDSTRRASHDHPRGEKSTGLENKDLHASSWEDDYRREKSSSRGHVESPTFLSSHDQFDHGSTEVSLSNDHDRRVKSSSREYEDIPSFLPSHSYYYDTMTDASSSKVSSSNDHDRRVKSSRRELEDIPVLLPSRSYYYDTEDDYGREKSSSRGRVKSPTFLSPHDPFDHGSTEVSLSNDHDRRVKSSSRECEDIPSFLPSHSYYYDTMTDASSWEDDYPREKSSTREHVEPPTFLSSHDQHDHDRRVKSSRRELEDIPVLLPSRSYYQRGTREAPSRDSSTSTQQEKRMPILQSKGHDYFSALHSLHRHQFHKPLHSKKTPKQETIEALQREGHSLEECEEAVRESGTSLEKARGYFKECGTCYTSLPMSKIICNIYCQCYVCSECFTQHYTVLAQSTPCMYKYVCPACQAPNLEKMSESDFQDYFGLLEIMLQQYLDEPNRDLYHTKLVNWDLMEDEDFRWCANGCGNGFINERQQKKLQCPHCNKYQCFDCKKPWSHQHDNMTCEQYDVWRKNNDPETQQQGIATLLKYNGIDCPKCKMHYELAKGGCMHFKCPQCQHEFCCGCNLPFVKYPECTKYQSCHGKGLHAHHPRDCLYYLRDQEVWKLQMLLQENCVDYSQEGATTHIRGCPVTLQLEAQHGLQDTICGKSPENESGLCAFVIHHSRNRGNMNFYRGIEAYRLVICKVVFLTFSLHYKEYLVTKINQNNIDPVEILTAEELTVIIRRHDISVPFRDTSESDTSYKERLRNIVQDQFPLSNLRHGSSYT